MIEGCAHVSVGTSDTLVYSGNPEKKKYIRLIILTNTTGSAITVTLKDKYTDINGTAAERTITKVIVPANSTTVINNVVGFRFNGELYAVADATGCEISVGVEEK